MERSARIARRVHELAREDFQPHFGKARFAASPDSEWQKVRETGTRLWLDTGDMDAARELWNAEFSALTTNNTLLNAEVQKGIYDELVGHAAAAIRGVAPDVTERELLLEIAFVLNAHHGLRLVDEFDANVSVELHTDLANDVARTVAYGKRYFAICPERFYVKVPLTPAGLLAARQLAKAGVPINFTLGFSARQNYVAARLTNPAYVNVFMGRLNAFVAGHALGDGENVGEKATLATQRELLQLRNDDLSVSLLIGASMRSGEQVASLAGLDVFTMPPKVASAYRQRPASELSSQVTVDPPVQLSKGISFDDWYASSLWDVPDALKAAVSALLEKDVSQLRPSDLQRHFTQAGLGDLLPVWSQNDIATVTADGKIPDYAKWKARLVARDVGLDALMNLAALQAFTKDQKALDDRVAGLIA